MSANDKRRVIGRDPAAWARARTRWQPTTLLPEDSGFRADVLVSTDTDAEGSVRGLRIVPVTTEPVEPGQTLILQAAALEALRDAASAAQTASPLPTRLRDRVDAHIAVWGRRQPRNPDGAAELALIVADVAAWARKEGLSPKAVVMDAFGISGPSADRWVYSAND